MQSIRWNRAYLDMLGHHRVEKTQTPRMLPRLLLKIQHPTPNMSTSITRRNGQLPSPPPQELPRKNPQINHLCEMGQTVPEPHSKKQRELSLRHQCFIFRKPGSRQPSSENGANETRNPYRKSANAVHQYTPTVKWCTASRIPTDET